MSKKDDNKTYYKRLGIASGIIVAVLIIVALATAKPPTTADTNPVQNQSTQEPVKEDPIKLNFSGSTDTATQEFTLREGLARFESVYTGRDLFTAWLVDSEGNEIDMIVNEIGDSNTSKAVRIDKAGKYLLNVQGNGSWTIDVTQG